MKTLWTIAALAAFALAAGCGQGRGFLIKPAPVNEKLEETTLSQDEGLWVTDKILVLDVDGLLMNARGDGFFGPEDNPLALFVEKLDKAGKDSNVRAVVLRINSPGGGVTATDLMYRRLAEFKEERKIPVVAMIEDVGASGAYYLACGADTIMVTPTSVTGSIGVIVQLFSLSGTMDKLGITTKALTSGPMKDMASPFKPLDGTDQKVLQAVVEEFYGRFLEVVTAGRPSLNAEKVKTLADGRIYTGTQAVSNGLADAAGDMKDAIDLAKKQAGVKAAKVVMYGRPWGYRANVYSGSALGSTQINLLNITPPDVAAWLRPQFLYLWTGDGGGASP